MNPCKHFKKTYLNHEGIYPKTGTKKIQTQVGQIEHKR